MFDRWLRPVRGHGDSAHTNLELNSHMRLPRVYIDVEKMEKTVLVDMAGSKKVVSFASIADSDELQALKRGIRKVFGGVLSDKHDFIIQVKNEEWGGEYVDHLEGTEVENKSIVRVQLKPTLEV